MGWNCHAQGSSIRALKTQSEIDQFGVGAFDFEYKRVSLGSWIEYLSARRWGWQRRWGRGGRWRWCASEGRGFCTRWCCHELVEGIPESLPAPPAFTVSLTVNDDCDPK